MKIPEMKRMIRTDNKDAIIALDHDLSVEEKIDGSQFSFGVIDGKLEMRSRTVKIGYPYCNKLFEAAVGHVKQLFDKGELVDGVIHRAEVLHAKRHNKVTYDRVPMNNMVLFDVITPKGHLTYPEKVSVAKRLGIEPVRLLGTIAAGRYSPLAVEEMIDNAINNGGSQLGGMIEGAVAKSFNNVVAIKHHHRDFLEVIKNKTTPKNDKSLDLSSISDMIGTDMRLNKSLTKLRELGVIDGSDSDIGKLIKHYSTDIKDECTDIIKDELFKLFWKQINKHCCKGVATWYKTKRLQEELERIENES